MAPSAKCEWSAARFICLFLLLFLFTKIVGHMVLSTPMNEDYKKIAANFVYYVEFWIQIFPGIIAKWQNLIPKWIIISFIKSALRFCHLAMLGIPLNYSVNKSTIRYQFIILFEGPTHTVCYSEHSDFSQINVFTLKHFSIEFNLLEKENSNENKINFAKQLFLKILSTDIHLMLYKNVCKRWKSNLHKWMPFRCFLKFQIE